MRSSRHRSNDFVHTITKTLTRAALATDYVSPTFVSFDEAFISFTGGGAGLQVQVQRSTVNPQIEAPLWGVVETIDFDKAASGSNRYHVRGKGWWRVVVRLDDAPADFTVFLTFAAEGLDTFDPTKGKTSGRAALETTSVTSFGTYSLRRNFPDVRPAAEVWSEPGVSDYRRIDGDWWRINSQGNAFSKVILNDPHSALEFKHPVPIDGMMLRAFKLADSKADGMVSIHTPLLNEPLYLLCQPRTHIRSARFQFLQEIFNSEAFEGRENSPTLTITEFDEKNVFLWSYTLQDHSFRWSYTPGTL